MPTPLTDFIAGYVSGVIGIIVGNPLDIIKVRIQFHGGGGQRRVVEPSGPVEGIVADTTAVSNGPSQRSAVTVKNANRTGFDKVLALGRGTAAPIAGYGALNALLFASYSKTKSILETDFPQLLGGNQEARIFIAGCIGSVSTFLVSTPVELVKCRTQLADQGSSWYTLKSIISKPGGKGVLDLYKGGTITFFRDALGYGVYFWSYAISKQYLLGQEGAQKTTPSEMSSFKLALNILLAGGIAGSLSWISIFPLDVIKTRYQGQHEALLSGTLREPLLSNNNNQVSGSNTSSLYSSSWDCAKKTYRQGGPAAFFHGIIPTMVRAFIVNAVQFATYELCVAFIEDRK